MKKTILCECGSDKTKDGCCAPKVKVWGQPFSNPNEYKEILSKIQISSQFGLRYRGLFDFYGDDLIAYKLENFTSQSRNKYLYVLGRYLTEYLEDDCPSSWKECQPSFWEEFIFSFYPLMMQVTPKEKEVEQFLSELKKFISWIDRRFGTSWYTVIEKYIEESQTNLKECEYLLNRLYLHTFPLIHDEDWDPHMNFINSFPNIDEQDEVKLSIFEVKNFNGTIVVVTAMDTDLSYFIKGLPIDFLTPGTIISGGISRKKRDWIWNWNHPESVFPQRAKKYLKHVKLGV